METVRQTLKKQIVGKKIKNVNVIYERMIESDLEEFKKKLVGLSFDDILRKGKWLLFSIGDYYLCSHLRMEGKYFIKKNSDEINKHEHVIFTFDDGSDLRYHDTRKFGKMLILPNDLVNKYFIDKNLGLDAIDETINYKDLYKKWHPKKIALKKMLLDQSFLAGIGNIYADEICFSCALDPTSKVYDLSKKDFENIVFHTQRILKGAIKSGGTTIRSYTSSLGVNGLFQLKLKVHNQKKCQVCQTEIKKIICDGRGTYRCVKCQKVKRKRG